MDKTTAEILKVLLEQMMANKRDLVNLGTLINPRFEALTPILRFLLSQPEREPQVAVLMDLVETLEKIGKSCDSYLNQMDFKISQMEAVIVRLKAVLDRESGNDSPPQKDGETDEPS